MLGADGLGEKYLAYVAFYLCLKDACLLVDGNKFGDLPGDPIARADCPMAPKNLRKLRDRVAGFRHEVLHLSDKKEDGRSLNMTWTIERPYPVFRSSVGKDTLAYDEMSKLEVEGILDKLDPWLRRHWDRLVHEDDDAEMQAALGDKINSATVRARGLSQQGQRCTQTGGRTHEDRRPGSVGSASESRATASFIPEKSGDADNPDE